MFAKQSHKPPMFWYFIPSIYCKFGGLSNNLRDYLMIVKPWNPFIDGKCSMIKPHFWRNPTERSFWNAPPSLCSFPGWGWRSSALIGYASLLGQCHLHHPVQGARHQARCWSPRSLRWPERIRRSQSCSPRSESQFLTWFLWWKIHGKIHG